MNTTDATAPRAPDGEILVTTSEPHAPSLFDDAPALPRVPFLLCPECDAKEPYGFVGKRSGAVVAPNPHHYRDTRGFYYCRSCFIVWDRLSVDNPPEEETKWSEGLYANERLGIAARFNAHDATDPSRYARLAALELKSTGGRIARARARIYDADVFATRLGLSLEVKSHVLDAVQTIALKVDLRKFRVGTVFPRAEAVVLAVIDHVCDRYHVGADPTTLLSEVTVDERPLGLEEFDAAHEKVGLWLAKNYWKVRGR